MNTLVRAFTVLFMSISAHNAMAQDCDEACQLSQVNAYFTALDKVARQGSSMSDIDALLALMDSSVKYIHVEYQADFDKASWRRAFKRQLELGNYQNSDRNEARIINSITGKNHIAIEYSHGLLDDDGNWQATDKYLAIFGFTNGKISLIKELW